MKPTDPIWPDNPMEEHRKVLERMILYRGIVAFLLQNDKSYFEVMDDEFLHPKHESLCPDDMPARYVATVHQMIGMELFFVLGTEEEYRQSLKTIAQRMDREIIRFIKKNHPS